MSAISPSWLAAWMAMAWGMAALAADTPPRVDLADAPVLQPISITPILIPGQEHALDTRIAPDGQAGVLITSEAAVDLWGTSIRLAMLGPIALGLFSGWWFALRMVTIVAKRWPYDRCRRCNYNLTGSRGQTCPECGAPSQDRIPASQRRAAWRTLAPPLLLILACWLSHVGIKRAWIDIEGFQNWTTWPSTSAVGWLPMGIAPSISVGHVRTFDALTGQAGPLVLTANDPWLLGNPDDPHVVIVGDSQVALWDLRARRPLEWQRAPERRGPGENPKGPFERREDRILIDTDGVRLRQLKEIPRPMAPDGAGVLRYIPRVESDATSESSNPGHAPLLFAELQTVGPDGAILRRFQFPRLDGDGELASLSPGACVRFRLSDDRRRLIVFYHNRDRMVEELQIIDVLTGTLLDRTPFRNHVNDDYWWEEWGYCRHGGVFETGDLLLISNGDVAVYHKPSHQWIARLPLQSVVCARFVTPSNELVLVAGSAQIVRFDLSAVLPAPPPGGDPTSP